MSVLVEKDEIMKEEKEDLIFQKLRTYMKRNDHRHECKAVTTALHSLTPLDTL